MSVSPPQQAETIRKVYADFVVKLEAMKKRHTTEITALIKKVESEKVKQLSVALRAGKKK